MDLLKQIIAQIVSLWQKIKVRQKITIVVVVVVFLVTLLLLISQTNQSRYSLLYSNLQLQEAAEIVEKLREENISYQLRDGGRTILISSLQVHDTRLQLAMEGIPRGGKIGFEIFDNTNILGMTQFMEKVNYQRALQGELARTIQSLSEIVESRVHLVIPDPTPFLEEKKASSASIVLKLEPGAQLGKNQIRGIAYLVATSVEDLSTTDITIIDGRGNILFGGDGQSGSFFLTSTQLEVKREVEQYLANKIYSLLTPLVGPNKVVARVNAQINFDQITTTQETYDPKGRVVQSETYREEIKKGAGLVAGGSPGVATNLGESTTFSQSSPSEESSEESSVQYLVNKTIEYLTKKVGNIEELSIAVAIDGSYQLNEDEVTEYLPRTEEDMSKFISMIQKAVGYDEARGDSISVVNTPFDTSYEQEQQIISQKLARQDFFRYLRRYIPLGISMFLLFLLIRSLKLKQILAPLKRKEAVPSEPGVEAEKEKREEVGEKLLPVEQEKLIEEHIFQLALNKPEQAAQIIKGWLSGNGRPKNDHI